jgi:hypothetical protein
MPMRAGSGLRLQESNRRGIPAQRVALGKSSVPARSSISRARTKGLVPARRVRRDLGEGELTKKLTIKAIARPRRRSKVEAAGGT